MSTSIEKRRFGKTDMDVSVLGFGGAEIGFHGIDPDTVEQLLNSALDAGLNVIDTAECYADSEEKIGKTIGHRRDEFHLFTKCGHTSGQDGNDWDVEMLRQTIDRSLKRLQTDRVDVIHLHSCAKEYLERGDVIEVLQAAKRAGKTRYIGYSGDSAAAEYAVRLGVFDSLQISINIADQEVLTRVLPLAQEAGLGVIAKRPIANVAWGPEPPASAYHRTYWDRLQALQYPFLAGDRDAAIAHALRFTLSQPGVHTAIVGTTKPGRWKQNAEFLAAGPLPEAEIAAIRNRWNEVAGPDWTGQQ